MKILTREIRSKIRGFEGLSYRTSIVPNLKKAEKVIFDTLNIFQWDLKVE